MITASSKSKERRLDEIEIQLTPKDWAIRLVDEFRKQPTMEAFFNDQAKVSRAEDAAIFHAYMALAEQAEKQFPGKRPEDIRAKTKLNRELRGAFHALKLLAIEINEDIMKRAEKAGLEAALRLSRLETTILQDAFGRTARKAAGWIEGYKTADKDDEENRQIMLRELAAYTDVYYGEKFSDSLPLPGGIRLRWPSFIEEWIMSTGGLIAEVFSIQEAVKIVQDKQFGGHPILFLDVEAALARIIKTLEDSAKTFNEYLKTRAEVFKADWEAEEEEDGFASAIPGEREGKLQISIDRIRGRAKSMGKDQAANWIKTAKDKATFAILDEAGEGSDFLWEKFREQAGTKP
jgi:hypothetical protein